MGGVASTAGTRAGGSGGRSGAPSNNGGAACATEPCRSNCEKKVGLCPEDDTTMEDCMLHCSSQRCRGGSECTDEYDALLTCLNAGTYVCSDSDFPLPTGADCRVPGQAFWRCLGWDWACSNGDSCGCAMAGSLADGFSRTCESTHDCCEMHTEGVACYCLAGADSCADPQYVRVDSCPVTF